ncbi:hypothetical protein FRC11_009825 [Ceratobasidium sp. 423]|nr:hypothetical protein FRC11_009825 [Ceratobasidium sp. 423]
MAQSTTSKITHNIVKYASHKIPLSAQVPTNEIQWKSHEGDHLRLTVAVTTTRAVGGTQPKARHVLKIAYLSEDSEETQNASQNVISEALLENLDLTLFSEITFSGRELPLKAVYKNRSVAFRYLYPTTQDGKAPQTYRRFQVTFKTTEDALNFVKSIECICPCSTARDQRTAETQATRSETGTRPAQSTVGVERRATAAPPRRPALVNRPIASSQISNLPLPRNATTYRKSTMFADVLSSQSLGDAGSSQAERPPSARTASSTPDRSTIPGQSLAATSEVAMGHQNNMLDERDGMNLDEQPSGDASRVDTTEISRVGSARTEQTPSPIQPEQTMPSVSTQAETILSRAQVQVSREQTRSSAVEIVRPAEENAGESSKIVSAIRQGDSDLYKLSFEELQQLVGEVIREPGFPELSISISPGYFSEQALFTPGPTTAQVGQAAFMANNFPQGPQTAYLLNTPGPTQSTFLAQQQQNRPGGMHRHHASIAMGMPLTPGGGMFQQQQQPHFAAMPPANPPQMGGLGVPPFVPRSRRTISIGGPPKAVLGGPNRKTSPLPPTPAGENAPGLPDVKKKKCTVKLPVESDQDLDGDAEDDEASARRTKSLWSRTPIPLSEFPPEVILGDQLVIISVEPHPEHIKLREIGPTAALQWDLMRQEIIEEKLAKLGVERGSGAAYLPSQSHGRAFSISTPADPTLLFSKLNKLQASQSPSSTSSPGPNSPFFHAPRLPHQHGYTQSLAVQPQFGYSPQLNGGLDLTTQKSPNLSTSAITSDSESQGPILHAPQGVVPVRATALSRVDFTRGFGLDVTEEEDEGQEDEEAADDTQTPSDADQNGVKVHDENGGFTQAFGQPFQVKPAPIAHSQPEPEADEEDADDEGDDSMTAAAHSRHHSRHLSHASLRSLGRRTMSEEPPASRSVREEDLPEGESEYEQSQARSAVETWDVPNDTPDVARSDSGHYEDGADGVADWTGSDTESIGEWSNPSDEERARQARRMRKLNRSQGSINIPRRIPDFPHPPHAQAEPYVPMHVDRAESEDIISNPSEEGFFGPIAPPPGAHSRQASVSTAAPVPTTTKLNASAMEFKPSGGMFANASFTFKLPPGVPTLAFGSGDSTSRSHLVEPSLDSPARATQGREKRQRRISDSVGLENTELDSPIEPIQKETPGRDNIATWRYPHPVGSPAVAPKVETSAPKPTLNPAAKPFSFSGSAVSLSRATLPAEAPQPSISAPVEKTPLSIFAPQTKRATLPEFALPSSGNTVPASVFKSLVQGDGPTRPTVRSRLSSREAFEGHSNRPSLDDINVPSISSRKVSKPVVTIQGEKTPSKPSIDVFGPIQSSAQKPLSKSPIPGLLKLGPPPRRASPSPAKSRLFSPNLVPSSPSDNGVDSSGIQVAVQNALDAKLDSWRKELTGSLAGGRDLKDKRELDNLAGPSELDLELIRSTIESGQVATRSMLQRELGAVMERMDLLSAAQVPHSLDSPRIAEDLGPSVLQPLAQLSSQLASLEESLHQQRAATQQDLLEQLTSALRPHFEAARAVPIDTDALTIQLCQAVKPHISQLIDLASDKRETATLIVQHLAPALNNIQPPRIDVGSLAAQTASALKSSMPPPTDPHVIKEHVADLVVERLDARLAVRDSSYNAETISKTIVEALVPVLQPTELASAVSKIDEMSRHQEDVLAKTHDLVKAQEAQAIELGGLPKALEDAIATLKSSHTEFVEKLHSITPLEEVQKIGATNLELQTELGSARAAHAQKANDEQVQQNHELQMKVNTLELQVTYVTRDLESSKRIASQLENQRNNLMAQQKHWDDLRRTAERVEGLCQQMEREDSEEIAELRRAVDESKILQGEHAYLKKRFEEQERRIADFTRGQQTAKQTITQAQQQAAEWERRAKEADTELDTYRARAEELEDANARLHEDFTQLQLKVKDLTDIEEKHKQQSQTMQNQIVALEHQLDALKTELADATRPQTPVAPVPQRNGVVTSLPIGHPRPLSRLSQGTSVYTPTRQGLTGSLHGPNGLTNGKLDLPSPESPPPEGVWASAHAPVNDGLVPPQTPRPSHARQAQHHRPRVPSPTHSIISTMTRDEDGWYS